MEHVQLLLYKSKATLFLISFSRSGGTLAGNWRTKSGSSDKSKSGKTRTKMRR